MPELKQILKGVDTNSAWGRFLNGLSHVKREAISLGRRGRNALKRRRLLSLGVTYRELHCFGDSHVELFDYLAARDGLPQTIIGTTSVPGATAQGAVNPNSRTNALQTFQRVLKRLDCSTHVLFMLGEVDCGFTIWYRAEKHGISVREQLDTSLLNYFELLGSVREMGFTRIYVCTAPPPTIRDGQDFGRIANLRREVKATQRERTDLTLEYNARLRAHCAEMGYMSIDVEDALLDAGTRLVNARFLNRDPADHHLEAAEVAPLYELRLRAAGFN